MSNFFKKIFGGINIQALKEKAEQGDAVAQNKLGEAYEYGKGVDQDLREAAYWYKKAAGKGLAEAQFNLGVLYGAGEGVPQSFDKAVELLEKASRQGHQKAKITLDGFRSL